MGLTAVRRYPGAVLTNRLATAGLRRLTAGLYRAGQGVELVVPGHRRVA
jgi:hypothetical protein